MVIQRFLIVVDKDDEEVNSLLIQGWKVLSVTAQHVAISGGGNPNWHNGNFAVVLEKESEPAKPQEDETRGIPG